MIVEIDPPTVVSQATKMRKKKRKRKDKTKSKCSTTISHYMRRCFTFISFTMGNLRDCVKDYMSDVTRVRAWADSSVGVKPVSNRVSIF